MRFPIARPRPAHRGIWPVLAVLSLAASASPPVAAPSAPVALWELNEGAGDSTVEQISGTQATLHGATWEAQGDGFALRFDGVDDYVDLDALPATDLRGPLSLEVWVHPDQPARGEPGIFGKWFDAFAITSYQGSCWFYIGSGANKVHAPLPVGEWTHVVATFDGADLSLYLNGEKAGSTPSTFNATPAGDHLHLGGITPDGTVPPSFFAGMIGAARLYDHALTWKEAALQYNADAESYGQTPVDAGRFDTIALSLFPYPERDELIARIDAAHVTLPLDRLKIRVALAESPATPAEIALPADDTRVEATLKPPAGAASVRVSAALLLDGTPVHTTDAEIDWNVPRAPVPDVAAYRAPPLPPVAMPPAYTSHLNGDGGIAVEIGEESYLVQSSFSYPHGGYNTFGLATSGRPADEPGWAPSRTAADTITAAGANYRITRHLKNTPSRIEITDEIANTTDEVIGVMLDHQIAGPEGASPVLNDNPTVFLAGPVHGAGMVPLDDVFFLRARNGLVEGLPALSDHHLGIAPGQTHTVRWAIYPTATTDYFDFVNQVRKDEQINGHVPGGFAFTSSWDVPAPEEVAKKGLAFYSWASLTRVLQDPVISLEGWEFTDYPELCDRIRAWIAGTRAANPSLETTFHVAHSLFATNEPAHLFPDSLAVDANGDTICYGGNDTDYYNRYFSPELVQQGWRWWIYYPTLENHYGRRMLDAADYMIQNLGATSVWADGYISGYVPGNFTYDHWDGVSVTIDNESKLVTEKKALVPHIAMPVLKAVAQKYTDAGGYLITNGEPGPFSFTRLSVISSCETGGGDQQPIAQLHLGRTVTPLGNPGDLRSFQDAYDDMLRKLDHGALYFWYGEQDFITEPTLATHMYPITFESIHPGTVRGEERIVTKVSGVYGWPGDRSLHRIHFFDARGRKRPNPFVSTVDENGVRTELCLNTGESAVIEKLPVHLQETAPLNVRLLDCAPDRLTLMTSLAPELIREIPLDAASSNSATDQIGIRLDAMETSEDADSLQTRGHAMLERMAEVNRYWLVGPSEQVGRYAYKFSGHDGEAKSVAVRDPGGASPAERCGITYDTALHALAEDPARAIITEIAEEDGLTRMQFRFAEPVSGACGNGVSGSWYGYFNLGVSEGTLWLDTDTHVPLELRCDTIMERFGNYVEVDGGHCVPLRIQVARERPGDEGMYFDWHFRLYAPGLWLLDQARYTLGHGSEPVLAAQVKDVRVNTEEGVTAQGTPIETRVLAETGEAREHRAAIARGQAYMDAVIDANRTWLRPSLEARRGLAYDYRQEGVYRERVMFDSEGHVLVQLEGEREGPLKPTRQRLYLPDGTEVVAAYGEAYVQEVKYPDTDEDRSEKIAQRDRHHLNLAAGLGWDCALTRMARTPSDFLAALEPGEDASTYRLILRSRNRSTTLFAGTMLTFTSWAYMHDVRYARSEIVCAAETHRPISETDYDHNGALAGTFHFSDYIDAPEGAPGRITALIPYKKDDVEQPLEMEAEFAFAKPGVWLLKKVHSEFRGGDAGSTGTVAVLPERPANTEPVKALRARLEATRALMAQCATLSAGAITLPATTNPRTDLWGRADAAALDADLGILLHVVSTEMTADGLRVTLEIISTANWMAHDVAVETWLLDVDGGTITHQTTTANVRAEQTPGIAKAELRFAAAAGVQIIKIAGKVTALTAEFYGSRWMQFTP